VHASAAASQGTAPAAAGNLDGLDARVGGGAAPASAAASAAPAAPAASSASSVFAVEGDLHNSQCTSGSYDKRDLIKSVSVSFDSSSSMILHANIDVAFSGELFQHSKDALVSIE